MTLLPNTPFAEGDEWNPELAYLAFNTPVFDGQTQYLGHRGKLTDAELDDSGTAIKARVAAIENGLKVSVVSGLNVSVASGTVRLPDSSTNLSIPTTQIAAIDNDTSYVFLDAAGTVKVSKSPDAIRVMLAKVVASAGAISLVEDLRHPAAREIRPIASAIKVFGGSNTTDKTATQGEVFDQGFYYYRNFTVPAGVTITVDKFARFFCSGNITIDGTVTVTYLATGAAPNGAVAGYGGGLPGSGIGAGSGSSGSGGFAYPFGAQPYGSGGGLGYSAGSGNVGYGAGGRGGGGLWLEAAGAIEVRGTITADGEDGLAGSILSGSCAISGSGAGSGGTFIASSLRSVTVFPSANILLRGGKGGNATNNIGGGNAMGGSGGGGGQCVLQSPANNISGANINTSGGARGTDIGSNPAALGGGGGGGNGGQGGWQSAGNQGKTILRAFTPIGN
jgi:hypothetical protein